MPDAVLLARERLPVGTLERIIEYRAYAEIRRRLKDGDTDLPDTSITALAQEIEFDLVREARDAATAQD